MVETPTFRKQAAIVWTAREHDAFVDFIAEHPEVGDVIPGAGGARKVRWVRRGMGKSGGVRVIYFHLAKDEVVLLLMVYAKADRDNVDPRQIKRS